MTIQLNIDGFIKLERAAQLATRAAGIFASGDAAAQLKLLDAAMAEMRHASLFLCDESYPLPVRQEALRRLLGMFKGAESVLPAEVSA